MRTKTKRIPLPDDDTPQPAIMYEPALSKVQDGMFNKGHQPTPYTRRQVTLLAAYRMSIEVISHIVNLSSETLRQHYKNELQHGLAVATVQVAERLYNDAVNLPGQPGINAAQFWLERNAGWKQQSQMTHTDPDGQPIGTSFVNSLTNAERAIRLAQLFNRVRVAGGGPIIDEREGALVTQSGAAD